MTDQRTYWNGVPADRWVREQAALDAMLRPFGDAALVRARPSSGERALDVGCGCGDTSLTLADRVGAGGHVVGLDFSLPMIDRARERSAGRSNLSFLAGDASREPLDLRSFDLLFSRFGVMFFTDPTAAFAHLGGALRASGRLAFVCWRSLGENPWALVPVEAVLPILGRPEPTPPDAPGPFSFGDATRVRRILGDAGFEEIEVAPFDTRNEFGAGGSIGDAARDLARLGPVARLLVDRSDAEVARAIDAIERTIGPFAKEGGGVSFPAAAWVVTAAKPA
jgi:SAM-dependent methyltransferase